MSRLRLWHRNLLVRPRRRPPPAAKRNETADPWVPFGQAVTVGGLTLYGGLLNVGSHLKSLSRWGGDEPEPSLIKPTLKLNMSNPDDAGAGVGYWASYSNLSPETRAGYLRWLAEGRNRLGGPIGFMFLYFYGLERRLLVDMHQAGTATTERPVLINEVHRLLDLYGDHGSVGRYLSGLLTAVTPLDGPRRYLSAPTPSGYSWEMPFGTALGLGQHVTDGRPIPTAWAQAWWQSHPESRQRTAVQRCPQEFTEIFRGATRSGSVRGSFSNTRLPKVVKRPKRAVTPEEFDALLSHIDVARQTLVLVAIETGMRWGELIALRPIDIDFPSRTLKVQRVILEVTKKVSPTGQRCIVRDYPKDDEARDVQVSPELCQLIREHMLAFGIRDDELLFATSTGTALSRNTFRTRVWIPAVDKAGLGRKIKFHDLRGAHASWLLAGGADLKVVMDRLGHRLITTTQQYLGSLPDDGSRTCCLPPDPSGAALILH